MYGSCGHKSTKDNPLYHILHGPDYWHGDEYECSCVICEKCLIKYRKYLKIQICEYLWDE